MSKVADIIVDKIIEKIEHEKILPWNKPFLEVCINYISGKPYRGINRLLLDGGEWITINQLKAYNKSNDTDYYYISKCDTDDLETQDRRKPHMIIYFGEKLTEISEDDYNKLKQNDWSKRVVFTKDGKFYKRSYFLRYYTVVNIMFCIDSNGNSLPSRMSGKEETWGNLDSEQVVSDYCERTGVRIFENSNSGCYYSNLDDAVHLTPRNHFENSEYFERVRFHELIHSTGVSSRLNRKCFELYNKTKEIRSVEEVIAELGSLLLSTEVGLRGEQEVDNSESYIASWISWIRDNKDAIITATFQAEKAKDFVLGKSQEETEE